jgi:hypothetical protein
VVGTRVENALLHFSSLYPSRRVAASSPPPDTSRDARPRRVACLSLRPRGHRRCHLSLARRTPRGAPVPSVPSVSPPRIASSRPSGGARSARAKRVPARSRDTCATRWRWR